MTAPGGPMPDVEPNAARGAVRWLRAVGAFLFWGAVQGLFLVPAGGLAPGPGPYRPLLPPALGAAVNLLVAAGFVWWFAARPAARRDPRRRLVFRLRPVPPNGWPWVGAAALGVAVAANAGLLVLPRFARLPPENPLVEAYLRVPGGPAALFVVAALVAPLLEEFFFRGWLQGLLERRAGLPVPWGAVLVTAAVFALLHGVAPFGLVPRFALAVALGYAAWATGSIWPSVALHAAYNAALFAGGELLPRLLPRPPFAESWADADRATFVFWAHEGRVFGPAVLALAAGAGLAAWALARIGAAAQRTDVGRVEGAAALGA